MKKLVIGYIYSGKKFLDDERVFRRVAKKNNVELIMINALDDVDEKEIIEKAKKCDILYNNTALDFAIEIAKTIESIGKKVIDSSESYYYPEDKWVFYVECMENKIPTPDTILLSENLNLVKGELKRFGHWPVVLKRIQGCPGEYVGRAEDIKQAIKIIKKFWKKGLEKLPIIAQEYINSPSYRVTVIGDKIIQTAIKPRSGWKAVGAWADKLGKFKVDKELKKIIEKVMKASKIKICGIDLLKKDDKWLVVEVNAEPTFGFFEKDREKMITEVIKFLIKNIKHN